MPAEFPESAAPAQAPEPRRFSRRALFIGTGAAVAVTAAVEATRRAGLWHLEDLGIGELAEEKRKLLADRGAFAAEYLQNPEAPVDTRKACDLFVRTEFARFARNNAVENIPTFVATTYEQFMERVRTRAGAERNDEKDMLETGFPSVGKIVSTKLALHDELGPESCYWAKRNNIMDGVVSRDIQCRSGSRLLQLALLRDSAQWLQPGERLVTIHTNHHIQAGLLLQNGRLIAFEMTKLGKGIQDLGPMKDITAPTMVTDACHDIAQAGLNLRAHDKQTVLFDNVPKDYARTDAMFDQKTPFGGGGLRSGFSFGTGGSVEATTDRYGFGNGKVEIPDERVPMTKMDRIPSNFSTAGEGNVYDTVRETAKGEGREIFRHLTAEEASAVRAYEQHTPVLSRHVARLKPAFERIANGESADVSADVNIVLEAVRGIDEYMDANDVDRLYDEYDRALTACFNRTKVGLRYGRNPRDMALEALERLKAMAR